MIEDVPRTRRRGHKVHGRRLILCVLCSGVLCRARRVGASVRAERAADRFPASQAASPSWAISTTPRAPPRRERPAHRHWRRSGAARRCPNRPTTCHRALMLLTGFNDLRTKGCDARRWRARTIGCDGGTSSSNPRSRHGAAVHDRASRRSRPGFVAGARARARGGGRRHASADVTASGRR